MTPAGQLATRNDISYFGRLRFPKDGLQLGKLRGSGLAGIFLSSLHFIFNISGWESEDWRKRSEVSEEVGLCRVGGVRVVAAGNGDELA